MSSLSDKCICMRKFKQTELINIWYINTTSLSTASEVSANEGVPLI